MFIEWVESTAMVKKPPVGREDVLSPPLKVVLALNMSAVEVESLLQWRTEGLLMGKPLGGLLEVVTGDIMG